MGLLSHKDEEPQDDLLELQKTIAMLKIIALDLKNTADTMEQKVDQIRMDMGANNGE